jgi:hypothetical protein
MVWKGEEFHGRESNPGLPDRRLSLRQLIWMVRIIEEVCNSAVEESLYYIAVNIIVVV